MTAIYDEAARADLGDIAEIRALRPAAIRRLEEAVTARGSGRNDRPALLAAHALHLAALVTPPSRRGPAEALVAAVLDPAALPRLLSTLSGQAVTEPAVAASGEQPAVPARTAYALPGEAFRLAPATIAGAFEFLHFLMVADGATRFAELRALFAAIDTTPGALQGSLGATTRAIARIAYDYRKQHFPAQDLRRRHGALLDAARARGSQGDPGERRDPGRSPPPPRFDDALILALWLDEIAAGERPVFARTVQRLVALERAHAAAPQRSEGTEANNFDPFSTVPDPSSAASGDDEAPRSVWDQHLAGEDDDSLLAALAAIPDVPNTLTGPERQLLATLFCLPPLHRDRPLTILRVAVFGAAQATLVGRHGNAGPLPSDAIVVEKDYAGLLEKTAELAAHLENVRNHVFKGSGIELPEGKTMPPARRIRRQGFDGVEPEQLYAALSSAAGAIATLADEASAFVRRATRHADAHAADLPVFVGAFRTLYAVQES